MAIVFVLLESLWMAIENYPPVLEPVPSFFSMFSMVMNPDGLGLPFLQPVNLIVFPSADNSGSFACSSAWLQVHVWLNTQPKATCPTELMSCVLFSTLGNVPETDPVVQQTWLYTDVFKSPASVYLLHSFSDAVYCMAVVAGIVCIRLQKDAKVREQDALATTAADFTLEVSAYECCFNRNIDSHSDVNAKEGLDELMLKLKQHFEQVAQVQWRWRVERSCCAGCAALP